MAAREAPYRKTFSFPKTDESTAAWWDAQADPSLSIKLLIRAEIEKHGYTDTANRPVVQLPRRGRPPKTEAETQTDSSGEAEYLSFEDEDEDEVEQITNVMGDPQARAKLAVDEPAEAAEPESKTSPAKKKNTAESAEETTSGAEASHDLLASLTGNENP